METVTAKVVVTKPGPIAWLMWSFGAAFFFYEFLVQISPNVMATGLMQTFNIQADKLGLLAGVFAYAYAFMQIPSGLLLDKLGPCRLLAGASALITIGCLLFANSTSFMMALSGRFLIGMGAASAVIGCMKIAANWFPADKFALVLGLTVSIGMSGAIMGSAPLAVVMEYYDWQTCMNALAVVGLLFILLFLGVCQNAPKSQQAKNEESIKLSSLLQGLQFSLKRKQVWLVAIYGMLMFAPSISFCGLWGVPFLQMKYQLSAIAAAGLTSLVFVGWLIGSPLCGYISDSLQRRKPTMIYGAILSLALILLVLYMPNLSQESLSVILLLFGITSSGFLPAFSIIKEISPKECSATVLSFMNTMNSLGPALLQPVIGILLATIWAGVSDISGVPIYSIANYQLALAVLPIFLLIACILVIFIDETYCKIIDY